MRGSSTQVHVRNVLRHLDEPGRLRCNPIVLRWVSLGADIGESVEQAILRLPQRFRTIIVRCDLAKELHSRVAVDLGISLRHFYRRRQQALEQLGELFASISAPRSLVINDDPIGVQLGHATALQNVGQFEAAISILERLKPHLFDDDQRVRIGCQLADLCCAAGMQASGQLYLAEAQAISTNVSTATADKEPLECTIEAARVRLAWHCRDLVHLQEQANRVVQQLRTLSQPPVRQRAAEDLISVLLVLVDLKQDRGDFGDALTDATEATSIVSRTDIMNPSLRIRCMTAVTNLRYFASGALGNTIEGLNHAFAYAKANALPREAIAIAGNLSGAFAIRGDAGRAQQFGLTATGTSMSVCSPQQAARTSLEVAGAYFMQGDLRTARSMLRQARLVIPAGDAYQFGMACLLDADLHLVEKHYAKALSVAQTARRFMQQIGSNRFRGSALRIEAECHEHLGHRGAAIRDIDESLRALESSGHAYILARAYDCSARVRARRSDRLAADDLTRMLRA